MTRLAGALLAWLAIALGAQGFSPPGTIQVSDLPAEARETIALIRKGGPFPWSKDGSTFGNREGLLPKRERGYYREYTVRTPGARDRAARRIVAGRAGELYYTADHYRSFRRVLE
jgi:ribonuclease T1